jgi:hypothetical protein
MAKLKVATILGPTAVNNVMIPVFGTVPAEQRPLVTSGAEI